MSQPPSTTGSLSTGQGTRFVLAATEHLHRRIAKLIARVRQLEDALAQLHSKYSNDTHPLLHDDLVVIDDDRDDDDALIIPDESTRPQANPDVIDAFGTLSISDHGISRFFGPTGGSESLLLANLESSHPNQGSLDFLTNNATSLGDLALFSQSFPFTPMGHPADVQNLIHSHLPPRQRALALIDTYFEQVSWIFRGVTRTQLVDDMLPVIYQHQPPPPGEDYSSPHDLALLFIVFSVGALVQPEPSNAEAEHFHQLARAALTIQPVLEKPSIVTIQTLHLMSIYNAMSGSDLKSETSMEVTWSLITLASHLSQTIGLHRDSARWGLSPKMVQRRRILFWDLFVADVWQSLNTGRPPSFSLAYIDCSFPQYENKGFGSAFEVWQCRFAAECVAEVTSRTLTAEAPSYTTIMELDHKVREFPLPEGLSNAPKNDLGASFQRCVLDHIKETVLMYIHRSFFAQAIIEQPLNPLKSVYAPSFLASYRAASTILRSVREQFNLFPNSCSRFWTMWTFAFTAAVVFGTVVTRGPRSPLAQSAMMELEQACILFTKASKYSIRALKALPILNRLDEKARYALKNAQTNSAGNEWNIQDKTIDELAIYAGHTRFVSAKKSVADLLPPGVTEKTALEIEGNPQLDVSGDPYQATITPQQPQRNIPATTTPSQVPSAVHLTDWQLNDHYNYAPLEHPTPKQRQREDSKSRAAPSSSSNLFSWSNDPVALHPLPAPPPQASTNTSHHHAQYQSNSHKYEHRVEGGPIMLHPPYTPTQPRQPPPPPSPVHQAQLGGTYLPPASYHVHHHYYPTTHSGYHTPPTHPSVTQANHHGTAELADLGLASRDSRLDERWSSFMADSGLLEGMDFRSY